MSHCVEGANVFPVKPDDKRTVWLLPIRENGVLYNLRFRFPLATAFIRGSPPLDSVEREVIDLATRVILKRPVQPDPYNLGDD